MSPTPDQIAKLASGRVLVVGDVMVDHYVTGRVSRVSDEAPVPIIHVSGERWTLGGAANVAANIASLGGAAVLVGVVGKDAAATTLSDLVAPLTKSVRTELVVDAGRPTTIKTRYMGGQHQIVRVDREEPAPISKETEAALISVIGKLTHDCRAVMISDYAKGALTDRVIKAAIDAAHGAKIPVIVDPKRAEWSAYRGASLITPNRKELTLATRMPCGSDAECAAAAAAAIKMTGAAILLTRSEAGMSLFRDGQAPIHLSAKAREVFDVSGAGDTVAAAAALGIASGLPVEAAMQIANIAAGIVVAKRGTATASPAELLAESGAANRGLAANPGRPLSRRRERATPGLGDARA